MSRRRPSCLMYGSIRWNSNCSGPWRSRPVPHVIAHWSVCRAVHVACCNAKSTGAQAIPRRLSSVAALTSAVRARRIEPPGAPGASCIHAGNRCVHAPSASMLPASERERTARQTPEPRLEYPSTFGTRKSNVRFNPTDMPIDCRLRRATVASSVYTCPYGSKSTRKRSICSRCVLVHFTTTVSVRAARRSSRQSETRSGMPSRTGRH